MTETERATLAGGCFWCTEAAFKELDGVVEVTSGYAGGHVEDPTYEAVCTGETGHAEVVQVEYDPAKLSYEDLLQVFFTVHDPTQLNRQGPDVGTQYRSAVFYHDDDQKETVERFVAELEAEGAYDEGDIVTEIEPLEAFYEAEEYHQDYYEKNPNDQYCSIQAEPKVKKVREKFGEKVAQ
ncbi:peptide-methionine (S)-S-oxide reductase MsrA [Halorussus salilacus]|uniref:peptide-methionine (S)-S-oxide reductase MsrA n=1 Tax=Halorussus salilacus TaxID=2953750 RepID=UPI0020A2235D|nr:peptide-methionine (S)-S-oxide reductase MsrA [Halorussus salilacus]USZ68990.1 peptide-methionine (S)-S-oxide reductase MsrA [Halorussus salilacus]